MAVRLSSQGAGVFTLAFPFGNTSTARSESTPTSRLSANSLADLKRLISACNAKAAMEH